MSRSCWRGTFFLVLTEEGTDLTKSRAQGPVAAVTECFEATLHHASLILQALVMVIENSARLRPSF